MSKKVQKTITDKELEILSQGNSGSVEILGKSYPIYPFNGLQVSMISTKLGSTLFALRSAASESGATDEMIVASLMSSSFDDVCAIAADVVGWERDSFMQLDYATILEVITEIIRVNRSFFSERVTALIERAKAVAQLSPNKPSGK